MVDFFNSDIVQRYEELLKVKPPYLQPKYPFDMATKKDIKESVKNIELTYNQAQNNYKVKKGGSDQINGSSPIIIFTV